jgi:hypothetical protein
MDWIYMVQDSPYQDFCGDRNSPLDFVTAEQVNSHSFFFQVIGWANGLNATE